MGLLGTPVECRCNNLTKFERYGSVVWRYNKKYHILLLSRCNSNL